MMIPKFSFRKLLLQLFGPTSKFQVGDSVEIKQGGQLMVIVAIIPNNETTGPVIQCRYFNPLTKEIEVRFFNEGDLKPINWYK